MMINDCKKNTTHSQTCTAHQQSKCAPKEVRCTLRSLRFAFIVCLHFLLPPRTHTHTAPIVWSCFPPSRFCSCCYFFWGNFSLNYCRRKVLVGTGHLRLYFPRDFTHHNHMPVSARIIAAQAREVGLDLFLLLRTSAVARTTCVVRCVIERFCRQFKRSR